MLFEPMKKNKNMETVESHEEPTCFDFIITKTSIEYKYNYSPEKKNIVYPIISEDSCRSCSHLMV